MKGAPLVSVIIPTFNRPNLTISAVQSVLNQEYTNLEIIVVDDGSSESMLNALKEKIPSEIQLITLPHSGLPAVARNAGVARAKGEWIAFLDSDDIWFSNKLTLQMQTAINGYWDCISADFIGNPGANSSKRLVKKVTRIRLASILPGNKIVNSSVLIRKACLMEVGGVCMSPNVRGVEDYATWLRLVSKFEWGHINARLGKYETSSSENSRISSNPNPYNNMFAIIDFIGWLRMQGKTLVVTRLLLKLIPLSLKQAR